MIEYLNNPALLILSVEIIIFLLVMNGILFFLLTRKNNKAVKALNALIKDIKEKGEENKKKMAEIILQPGLTDPEVIKTGLQELVAGQNQFYKDMIKAIRTQDLEDVSNLGDSVSGLITSAINLGRESGEGLVDKEAQEKLEQENADLAEEKTNLESKLKSTSDEMSVLMNEYKSMMTNKDVEEEAPKEDSASEETSDEAIEEPENKVVDISDEDDVVEESEVKDDAANNNSADELMQEILGDDDDSDSEEKSEEQKPEKDDSEEQAA